MGKPPPKSFRNPVAPGMIVIANHHLCEAIPVSIKATSAVSRRGAEFAEKGLILGKVTYYKGDVFYRRVREGTQRKP